MSDLIGTGHRVVLDKMFDANVRMEMVIYLAGQLAGHNTLPDALEEFFDTEELDTIQECFGEIPPNIDLDETSRWERDEQINEWLSNSETLGFLVQFATPVMESDGTGGSIFSWGCYTTKWVYAETMDEAVVKGLAWAEECRRKEDERANSLPESVCVIGSASQSGTRNAERIAKHLGLTKIISDDGIPGMATRIPPRGALVLTTDPLFGEFLTKMDYADVMKSIEEAEQAKEGESA